METTYLLTIVLVVLVIYCFMYHFVYNKKNSKHSDSDISLDTKVILLDKIIESNKNKNNNSMMNNSKSKEQFELTLQEGNKNYLDLQNIEVMLNTMDTKNKLLTLLQNQYEVDYNDSIDKENALAYKEYLKYRFPEQNQYYQMISRT